MKLKTITKTMTEFRTSTRQELRSLAIDEAILVIDNTRPARKPIMGVISHELLLRLLELELDLKQRTPNT